MIPHGPIPAPSCTNCGAEFTLNADSGFAFAALNGNSGLYFEIQEGGVHIAALYNNPFITDSRPDKTPAMFGMDVLGTTWVEFDELHRQMSETWASMN